MSSSQGSGPPTGTNGVSPASAVPPRVKRAGGTSPFMQKKPRFVRGQPAPKSVPVRPVQTTRPPNQITQAAPNTQPQEEKDYVEYPIVISKADLGRGMRFHGLRFQSKAKDGSITTVDPYSEAQFVRPLHLHRRYARDKQQQQADGEQNGEDDKEKELHNARRAERQAEREANQALIAPGAKKSQVKRKKNQKNVEDVYYDENNPKQQKAAQLRYEETKPWHLEDFEGKNVWIGSYQEPLSESGVLFQISADAFTMVPVERWYSFRQTDKIKVMNSDEVEKHMSKRYAPGRWFLKGDNEDVKKKPSSRIADEDDIKPKDIGVYRADLDELDFEAKDEFQDDDEGLIFGEDDEIATEIEKKVREEMREANLPATNMKNDEKDWDEAERQQKQEQKDQRKLQKKLRKRIVKHEKKYEYDSDSDHPYSESSDDEDSEEEQERRLEEERKKEEAVKLNGGKSGASTQGTNTPAGRTEKHPARPAGLKRPGSPSLSEVSGNESRKRVKVTNGRPDGARSPLARSAAGGYGSGSETDASRAGRRLNRLASPHEGTSASSQPGSRMHSPGRSGTPALSRLPTLEEIRAAIPPAGISVKDLGSKFKARVSKDKARDFIDLIKNNIVQDPVSKLLMPGPKPVI